MPTIYLLDSNIISALTQNKEAAWEHWADLPDGDETLTCFVVIAEWEYGVRNANGRRKQQEIREQGELIFSEMARIIESSPEINLAYGEIAAELRGVGTMIPQNDIWIAAVARVLGATLVTHDGHFARVNNLSVIDWTVA